MKQFLPILLFLFSCSSNHDKQDQKSQPAISTQQDSAKPRIISDPTNTLSGKIQTLELEYMVWGCACANWITTTDRLKYDTGGLAQHSIFIEPAHDSIKLPSSFDAFRHRIKVKGQFYTRPDYPKGTIETEEKLEKAKVFRYTELKLIAFPSNAAKAKDTTLILAYNAIACTCPQWSSANLKWPGTKDDLIFLERGNDHIVDADTLFNGTNLPLQLKVTGRFVSNHGYPEGYAPAKGNPDPAPVFRYTRIRVIKNGGN